MKNPSFCAIALSFIFVAPFAHATEEKKPGQIPRMSESQAVAFEVAQGVATRFCVGILSGEDPRGIAQQLAGKVTVATLAGKNPVTAVLQEFAPHGAPASREEAVLRAGRRAVQVGSAIVDAQARILAEQQAAEKRRVAEAKTKAAAAQAAEEARERAAAEAKAAAVERAEKEALARVDAAALALQSVIQALQSRYNETIKSYGPEIQTSGTFLALSNAHDNLLLMNEYFFRHYFTQNDYPISTFQTIALQKLQGLTEMTLDLLTDLSNDSELVRSTKLQACSMRLEALGVIQYNLMRSVSDFSNPASEYIQKVEQEISAFEELVAQSGAAIKAAQEFAAAEALAPAESTDSSEDVDSSEEKDKKKKKNKGDKGKDKKDGKKKKKKD